MSDYLRARIDALQREVSKPSKQDFRIGSKIRSKRH